MIHLESSILPHACPRRSWRRCARAMCCSALRTSGACVLGCRGRLPHTCFFLFGRVMVQLAAMANSRNRLGARSALLLPPRSCETASTLMRTWLCGLPLSVDHERERDEVLTTLTDKISALQKQVTDQFNQLQSMRLERVRTVVINPMPAFLQFFVCHAGPQPGLREPLRSRDRQARAERTDSVAGRSAAAISRGGGRHSVSAAPAGAWTVARAAICCGRGGCWHAGRAGWRGRGSCCGGGRQRAQRVGGRWQRDNGLRGVANSHQVRPVLLHCSVPRSAVHVALCSYTERKEEKERRTVS